MTETSNQTGINPPGRGFIAVLFFLVSNMSLWHSTPLWGFVFVPELERINASFGDAGAFKNLYQMDVDDTGRLCIAAHHLGLVCYDGLSLEPVYEMASGLVAINDADGQRKLFFSDGYNIHTFARGQVALHIKSDRFNFTGQEIIKHLLPIDPEARSGTGFFVISTHAVYRYSDGQLTKMMADREAVPIYASLDQGRLRVGTHKGLVTVDEYGVRQRHFEGLRVNYLIGDLVLTNRGVYHATTRARLARGNFITATRTRAGTLLLGGYRGLCTYKPAADPVGGDQVQQADNQPGHHPGRVHCPRQTNDVVYSLFADRFNTVWAATNNGLKQTRLSAIQRIDTRYGLGSDNVLDVAAMGNTVFMATPRGVNTFDSRTGQIAQLEATAELSVTSLLPDNSNNTLWIATSNSGLYRYDLVSDHLQVVDDQYTGYVVDLALFNERIWAATLYDGFNLYDRDGNGVRRGMHKGIKKIRKLAVCNNSLYFSSQRQGLIRLEKNADVLALSDEPVLNGIFACTRAGDRGLAGTSIVSASRDRLVEHDTDLRHKRDWHKLAPGTDITALFDYGHSLWQLDARGLKRLSDGRNYGSGQPLDYLYNNIVLVNGNYLFAGSPKGLVAVHMPSLVNEQHVPVALVASMNHSLPAAPQAQDPGQGMALKGAIHSGPTRPGDGLSISLFIDDLSALHRYRLYYRYSASLDYRPLTRGNLTLDHMPDSGRVWFRAVAQHGPDAYLDLDLEPYQAVLARRDKGNITNNHPVIVLFYSGLLWLACTMLYRAYCRFVRYRRGRAMGLNSVGLNSVPGDSAREQADAHSTFVIDSDPSQDEPCLSSIASEAELRQALARHGRNGNKLIACMDVLQRQPGLKFAKTLAYEAGISNDALRDCVQKLFGFKTTKEFIAYYRRLQRQ